MVTEKCVLKLICLKWRPKFGVKMDKNADSHLELQRILNNQKYLENNKFWRSQFPILKCPIKSQ